MKGLGVRVECDMDLNSRPNSGPKPINGQANHFCFYSCFEAQGRGYSRI